MTRRLMIVVVAALVLLAILVGFNTWKQHFVAQMRLKNAAPPQTVTATEAHYTDWQPEVTAVGSLRAVHGVDVTTEVTGLVRSLRFKSGDEVSAGQVLVEMNADSEIAQQHALEAAAELANTVYNRDKIQFEAQAISKAQLDADAADLKNKRAQAAAQAALVGKKDAARAVCRAAGHHHGEPRSVSEHRRQGRHLAGDRSDLRGFRLPQQQLAAIAVGQIVTMTADSYPGQTFRGKITAMDPRVDPSTRNFQAEATLSNSDRKLFPGMFGRVAVFAGQPQRYLTLPQTAITYNPYGATVFLARKRAAPDPKDPPAAGAKAKKVGPPPTDLVAAQSFVTLGPTRGDQVAVIKGISEGDLVVTSGQLKLINGTPLIIDNSLLPPNDPNPAPQEH